MKDIHLHDELSTNNARLMIKTPHGIVTGGRAFSGAWVFLEVPYALPPRRFEDPEPLPKDYTFGIKECVTESNYAVQPSNDGQSRDLPFEDKVGLGKPSENPLFVNIVAPPMFSSPTVPFKKYPVKVYIHGGFLQFGSPHSLMSQAQYISSIRSEVWVNIGYRLSAFGFLACDEPKLTGNYGFKDQWIALEWVRSHIHVFGGDPNDIQVLGLSAGAHSVHQMLHRASRLPEGQQAPFQSAVLQSNAILTNPKTPSEYRAQFQALCRALDLDPEDPGILSTLRDTSKVPWSSITHVIETGLLGEHGTFRGCLNGDWLSDPEEPMAWQRSGGLARGLRAHGVRSVVVGDLTEEWYLYSIAHPIRTTQDIVPNLKRYLPDGVIAKMIDKWRKLPDDAGSEEAQKLYGEILSCGQVHLPVRLLVRDLHAENFPVFRYEIRWTPEQHRPEGYVTHGTDRSLWAFRVPALRRDQAEVAKQWLIRIQKEVGKIELERRPLRGITEVLTLREDKTIEWTEDSKWGDIMSLRGVIPDELEE